MLLYSFTISNQINGIEEDRLNKPDRPIVSGQVNLNGAYARYFILIAGILIVSYAMKVQIGAVLFVVFGAMHNFTRLSSFGPTKDFFTTAVLTSGLYCAWKLGSGNEQTGAEWISCLAVNLFFSVSIQDLRDITGDAATNRWTTPLLLGEPYGRFSIREVTNSLLMRTNRTNVYYRWYRFGENINIVHTISTEQAHTYLDRVHCANYNHRYLLTLTGIPVARYCRR